MPNYFNPASMLIQGGIDPKSPFAGALAGIQGAYAMKAGDQAQRDSEMEFMANLEKYQQALLDRDALASNREASIAKNKYEAEDYSSGRKLEREAANTDFIRSQTRSQKTSADSKEMENQGNFLVELAQEIQTNDFQPMKDEARWNDYRERGKKLGLTLPAWLEDRDKMFIISKAQSFVKNAAQQRSMLELEGRGKIESQVKKDQFLFEQPYKEKEKQLDRENAERIAGMRTDATTEAAKIRAGAGNQRMENLVTEVVSNPEKYANQPAVIEAVVDYQWQKALSSDDSMILKSMRDPSFETKYKEALRQRLLSRAKAPTSQQAPNKPTQYSAQDEQGIQNVMKTNPGATREQVIEALKKAGKLRGN